MRPRASRIAVAALLLAAGVAAAALLAWRAFESVAARPLTAAVELQIERGDSLAQIARRAQAAGLAREWEFFAVARLRFDPGKLQAGKYRFATGDSLTAAIAKITAGKVVPEKITIIEGVTFAQMRAQLKADERISLVAVDWSADELRARLNIESEFLEGMFLPDTYLFAHGASDFSILRRANRKLLETLDLAWNSRDKNLPLADRWQALTLASIIEKETGGREDEAGLVASVFFNRLRRGMRLQSDPTVIYGMGDNFRGALSRADLRRDSRHNTYTRAGLPPTPIALVGRPSIFAATNPPRSDFLYFVADGVGGHVFSRTLREHNRAVRAYRRRDKS